jgi:hypothetical protein
MVLQPKKEFGIPQESFLWLEIIVIVRHLSILLDLSRCNVDMFFQSSRAKS